MAKITNLILAYTLTAQIWHIFQDPPYNSVNNQNPHDGTPLYCQDNGPHSKDALTMAEKIKTPYDGIYIYRPTMA